MWQDIATGLFAAGCLIFAIVLIRTKHELVDALADDAVLAEKIVELQLDVQDMTDGNELLTYENLALHRSLLLYEGENDQLLSELRELQQEAFVAETERDVLRRTLEDLTPALLSSRQKQLIKRSPRFELVRDA